MEFPSLRGAQRFTIFSYIMHLWMYQACQHVTPRETCRRILSCFQIFSKYTRMYNLLQNVCLLVEYNVTNPQTRSFNWLNIFILAISILALTREGNLSRKGERERERETRRYLLDEISRYTVWSFFYLRIIVGWFSETRNDVISTSTVSCLSCYLHASIACLRGGYNTPSCRRDLDRFFRTFFRRSVLQTMANIVWKEEHRTDSVERREDTMMMMMMMMMITDGKAKRLHRATVWFIKDLSVDFE